jgi:hypothetical protein
MESMNNKDFEKFLKTHKFKEKASEKLLNRIQNEAPWNKPWYTTAIFKLAAFLLIALTLAMAFSEKPEQKPQEQHFQKPIETTQPTMNIIADYRHDNQIIEEPFSLDFENSPATFIDARMQLAWKYD